MLHFMNVLYYKFPLAADARQRQLQLVVVSLLLKSMVRMAIHAPHRMFCFRKLEIAWFASLNPEVEFTRRRLSAVG
jgi:hypothetical protein